MTKSQTNHDVYLSLGSNIGDRVGNIRRALSYIAGLGTNIVSSSYYETEPIGVSIPQPRFINIVAKINTALPVEALAEGLRGVEAKLGRLRKSSVLPRTIDVDILLYDTLVMSTARLTLPHPQIFNRAFVLKPLCEIAPDLTIPTRGETVRQLLKALPATKDTEMQKVSAPDSEQ